MSLRENPLFRRLASLNLPPADFVVAGSGSMLAHGIKTDVGDLDVVARGDAWKAALRLGKPVRAPRGHAHHMLLFGGEIEILDAWFDYKIDDLIGEAEEFEGVNFCPLWRVVEWKTLLGREKDRADIDLIGRYLESRR
jgi:hypothetical protein